MLERLARGKGTLSIQQRAMGWSAFLASLSSYVEQLLPLEKRFETYVKEQMHRWVGCKGWFPDEFYVFLSPLLGLPVQIVRLDLRSIASRYRVAFQLHDQLQPLLFESRGWSPPYRRQVFETHLEDAVR